MNTCLKKYDENFKRYFILKEDLFVLKNNLNPCVKIEEIERKKMIEEFEKVTTYLKEEAPILEVICEKEGIDHTFMINTQGEEFSVFRCVTLTERERIYKGINEKFSRTKLRYKKDEIFHFLIKSNLYKEFLILIENEKSINNKDKKKIKKLIDTAHKTKDDSTRKKILDRLKNILEGVTSGLIANNIPNIIAFIKNL